MKRKSLLEQAKDIQPCKVYKGLLDKLADEQRKELETLVDAYLDGALIGDWNIKELYLRVVKPNGFDFSYTTFKRWVQRHAEGRNAESIRASKQGTTQGRKARHKG